MGEMKRSKINFVWCSVNLEDLISIFNVGTFKFKDQCYPGGYDHVGIVRSAKDGDQCLIPRFTTIKLWLQEMIKLTAVSNGLNQTTRGGGKPTECNWQI